LTPLLDIQNEAGYGIDEERLQAAIIAVLNRYEVSLDIAMTIVFTDNDQVAALNQQFRGVDAPTDVLSFPADKPPVEIPDEPPYLGDLVIAYPYASAQAQREGHDLSDSLALLVVHGTLHLLGYDHDTPERRAEMWAQQAEILRELGISPDIAPSLEEGADDE
jgi:probable rRNA maturation factor